MFRQRGTNWQQEWGETRKKGLWVYLAVFGLVQFTIFFILLGVIDWVFEGYFPTSGQLVTNAISAVIYGVFISLFTWYNNEKRYKVWLERTSGSQHEEDDH